MSTSDYFPKDNSWSSVYVFRSCHVGALRMAAALCTPYRPAASSLHNYSISCDCLHVAFQSTSLPNFRANSNQYNVTQTNMAVYGQPLVCSNAPNPAPYAPKHVSIHRTVQQGLFELSTKCHFYASTIKNYHKRGKTEIQTVCVAR